MASLKNRFAGALAAPRDVGLLQQTLAYALDPDVVRPQVRRGWQMMGGEEFGQTSCARRCGAAGR